MPLVVSALILLLLVYLLHKVRHAHLLLYQMGDQSRRGQDSLFRQLEALHGLYAELDLRGSLPPTRGWAASPDFLLVLARHARAAKPRCVVECSSGISTLVLARCLQLNGAGRVISLEHDRHYAEQTRAQLRQHGLQDWALVLDAPLQPQTLGAASYGWYDLSALPADLAIDMLAIDGPPQATGALARYPAGPQLFPLLAPGAHVFLDDADRQDEVAILQQWQAEFPQLQQSTRPCEKGCAVLVKAS